MEHLTPQNLMRIKIRKNISLAPYTNYKIGGLAQYFCEAGNKEEIIEALSFAHKENVPVFILGGGTNVLIGEKGFDGLVIRMDNSQIYTNRKTDQHGSISVNLCSNLCEFVYVKVGAETLLSDVIKFSLKNGLSGLEWAAGIPGTVGGAIRGNAGAFGSCVADVVESVKILGREQGISYKLERMNNKTMKFGYRTSIVKEKGGMIVLETVLRLKRIRRTPPTYVGRNLDGEWNHESKIMNKKKIEGYIKYRKEHHPLEYPSCGSVFKNITFTNGTNSHEYSRIKKLVGISEIGEIGVKRIIPAAMLIEKAGLCGRKIGNAQVSEKHCNFIINLGGAKAKDVKDLIELCQKEVFKKFGVKLKPEVEMVGFDEHITHNT